MIVIDGVIWQSEGFSRSPLLDQSYLWLSLIEEWVKAKKATKFVVLTRGQTWLPPGTFFSEIPRFAFAEADEDRTGLQSACDQLKARLFLSTGYTTPISTPSIAFIYDLEAEAGSQFHSEYIEKKNAILAASHYVFFSDEVLAGFRTHYPGIPPEQMSLVYPAIEGWAKPAAPDAMAEFRRKFQLTRPFFLAVLPEQLADYRGIQAVSQAWEILQGQRLSRTELVFAFPSPLEVDPVKAQLPQREGLRYLSLNNPELACAYSSALALVFHSTFRPSSPLEAMACGCPVVHYRDESSHTWSAAASDEKSDKDPLQNSTALLCQGSLQDLVDALQRIQSYPVRSPLIAKGLEQAKELSWSTVADKLWEIFDRVAPPGETSRESQESPGSAAGGKLTDR